MMGTVLLPPDLSRRVRRIDLLLFLAMLGACAPEPLERVALKEASGVVRQGNSLLVVDDEIPSAYFRFTLGSNPQQLLVIEPGSAQKVVWSQSGLAIDLESIDVLSDGRVVVLSERLRALVDEQGVVVEYGPQFGEMGERGLEGVAITPLENGSSRIAVLWEGGYPEDQQLPPQIRSQISFRSLQPILQIHELERDARGLRVLPRDGSGLVPLKVPLLETQEPGAQRFRAPDLVWLTGDLREEDTAKADFIVLLSSQDALPARKYENHWLLRFTAAGEVVGDPVDLNAILTEDLRGLNWEGLSWFEEGKSLVAVCETSSRGGPVAFILPLPPEWEDDGTDTSPRQ